MGFVDQFFAQSINNIERMGINKHIGTGLTAMTTTCLREFLKLLCHLLLRLYQCLVNRPRHLIGLPPKAELSGDLARLFHHSPLFGQSKIILNGQNIQCPMKSKTL